MAVLNSFRVLSLSIVAVFAIYYFGGKINDSVDRLVRRGYKPPTRCMDSGVIALTFDQGVSPDFTPGILNELSKAGVKATFHVDTTYLNDQLVTGIISRIKSDGHEIGIVYKGPSPTSVQTDALLATLRAQAAALQATTGVTPRFVRFPFQSTTAEIDDFINKNGFVQSGWTLDTGNPALCKSPKELSDSINNLYKSRLDQFNTIGGNYKGSLISLHSDLCSEGQALSALLPLVKDKYGYSFVSMSACLNGGSGSGSGTSGSGGSTGSTGGDSGSGTGTSNTGSNNKSTKSAAGRRAHMGKVVAIAAVATLALEFLLMLA